MKQKVLGGGANVCIFLLDASKLFFRALFSSCRFQVGGDGISKTHLSNERNLGWLGYIGDEQLPSYTGIINKPF